METEACTFCIQNYSNLTVKELCFYGYIDSFEYDMRQVAQG
jgi:hypothetical protein